MTSDGHLDRAVSAGPPPLDTELAVQLTQIRPSLPSLRSAEDIPIARSIRPFAPLSEAELTRDGVFAVEHALVEVDNDTSVPLVVFRNVQHAVLSPPPVFFFVHGGGMYRGDPLTGIDQVLDWATLFGASVASVDYRVAPEHPHPAPVSDCFAGLKWLADNAALIGVDERQIIVVGISAGGGLAAATVLMARDRGRPHVFAQLLMCPMLDDRNDSFSARQMMGHDIWDRVANGVGWTALLGDARGNADVPSYAAPARAVDLSGLPPTYLDAGSAETFRDEVVDYAARIWQSAGSCELHIWPGAFHGFDTLVPDAQISQDARRGRERWLARQLAHTGE